MTRLVVEEGVDRGMVFPLRKGINGIGRSATNVVQVIDRRMSRNHAEVIIDVEGPRVRDLGSKNGTYLNNLRLEGTAPIKTGDRIRIGETIFLFEMEEGSTPHSGEITTKSFRLVDEKQWGRTAESVRAGADPHLTVRVDAAEGELLKDSHRRLEILYQVADAIRSILDLDELLEKIMDIIFSVVQPDRGYILLRDDAGEEMTPRVLKRRDGKIEEEIQISHSIVHKCVEGGTSLLVTDATTDQRFSASESIVLNRIRSAMCAPLIFKDEVLGVVYVDTQSRIVAYSREELELLTGIANQSATAIINAKLHEQLVEQHKLAREMEIARSIQMNLLPKAYPDLPGYDISAMSLPAKQVGGDYYDFHALEDGRVGLTIADVSGKGVPAAFLTAVTRTYIKSEAQRPDASPGGILQFINKQIYEDVTNDMYVTLVFGVLSPKEGVFRYVNAGHAYPLLFEAKTQKVRELDQGGTFIGILEEVDFDEGEIQMAPGDVLVLYTDGVTDMNNPKEELWGRENLEKTIKENLQSGAEDIRNAIFDACQKHRGEADQFDDFTLIVIKRTSNTTAGVD